MNLSTSLESGENVANILGHVRKKGVRLWTQNRQLHYTAPKGVLAPEEIERLRRYKEQIVALLEAASDTATAEPTIGPRPQFTHAPLAYSQLAHWHLHQLVDRRSSRQIASAKRLCGRLDIEALHDSVTAVVRRHDALRTRIVVHDGVPIQEITESPRFELEFHDLTECFEALRETEVLHLIEQHILEPIDVAMGPLFGARLLRLGHDEHILIVAMEHMISDMLSMNNLWRDLLTAYTQAKRGFPPSLPVMPVQFADYAFWQKTGEKSWIEKHGRYWNARLKGCKRLKFPDDRFSQTEKGFGWHTAPVKIGKELKAELREWCRLRRTTLVLGVFTAYIALVLRWCKASDGVIQYQTDGRMSPAVENSVGYFAAPLYVCIELHEDDTFVELMDRVISEYCKAYEHADFSYMAAQVPRPEFTLNTLFNWIPDGSAIDLSDLDGSADAITCSQVHFAHPVLKHLELDHEPVMLLYETDDEVVGGLDFPLSRFSTVTMERFGRNFLFFIMTLLRQPEVRVNDIALLE